VCTKNKQKNWNESLMGTTRVAIRIGIRYIYSYLLSRLQNGSSLNAILKVRRGLEPETLNGEVESGEMTVIIPQRRPPVLCNNEDNRVKTHYRYHNLQTV